MKLRTYKIFGILFITYGIVMLAWIDRFRALRNLLTFNHYKQAFSGTTYSLILSSLKEPLGLIAIILIGVLALLYGFGKLETNKKVNTSLKITFGVVIISLVNFLPCFLPGAGALCGVGGIIFLTLASILFLVIVIAIAIISRNRKIQILIFAVLLLSIISAFVIVNLYVVKEFSECESIQDVWKRQWCYRNFADFEQNPEYCHSIVTDPAKTGNVDFTGTKDSCFLVIARGKQDSSLCENIQSQETKELCYKQVSEKID